MRTVKCARCGEDIEVAEHKGSHDTMSHECPQKSLFAVSGNAIVAERDYLKEEVKRLNNELVEVRASKKIRPRGKGAKYTRDKPNKGQREVLYALYENKIDSKQTAVPKYKIMELMIEARRVEYNVGPDGKLPDGKEVKGEPTGGRLSELLGMVMVGYIDGKMIRELDEDNHPVTFRYLNTVRGKPRWYINKLGVQALGDEDHAVRAEVAAKEGANSDAAKAH